MRVDPDTDPLEILWQINNRVNAILACHGNKNADLSQFRVYGGAGYYVTREAEKVSDLQALRAMETIGRVDMGLKGGSSVNRWTQLETLVDTLCMVFSRQALKS